MWRTIVGEERETLLEQAVIFTGNAHKYGQYMRKVIVQWPYSAIHNLSNLSMNRQAWIGHAACCIAIHCSEDITRNAWHYLTDKQRDKANHQADIAIQEFERKYFKGIQLCQRLG